MYYKYLNEPSLSRSMQSIFKGINKNARIGDGEFADMQNMSGDAYPLMMPRAKRVIAQKQIVDITEVTNEDGTTETVETPKRLNGILGDVGFCAVWGNDFYYMGKKVEGVTLADSEKNMVAMGGDILIYPDGVYFNTVTEQSGSIGENEKKNGKVDIFCSGRFNLPASTKLTCNIYNSWRKETITSVKFMPDSGNENPWVLNCLTDFSIASNNTRPYSWSYALLGKKDGYMWYCSKATVTRNKTNTGYKYNFAECEWTKLDISSFSLTASEFSALGFTDADLDNLWCGDTKVKIEKQPSGSLTNYLVTNSKIADALSIKVVSRSSRRAIGTGLDVEGTWRVRTIPILDYVCVHDNRLWGCRYGKQVTSDGEKETVNEIYCSALGKYKEWTFSDIPATLAGSPYAMSVGDYGPFTGCVSLRGHLLFFKDDIVYRVSGNKPSNFTIDKIGENGLQSGCEKSLEIIDGVLFYKSRNGVFAYDGSIPQKISDALGNAYYTDAVAGKLFSKYYITMKNDNVRKLYVYDTKTGIWHAEDSADVRFFTEYNGALYGAIENDIVCLSGDVAEIFNATESESAVRWYAESGDIGLDSPYPKYFHRLLVRMDIDIGARVKVSLHCGDDWMQVADYTSAKKQTVTLPIVTPRCEHMRIRIEGVGMAKIYSIYYETETVEGRP